MTYREFVRQKNEDDIRNFRDIFDQYCGYVHTIVFNILRSKASKEDIEECVSDVFADVYRYYDGSKLNNGDMAGFIGIVAKRKAYRYYSTLNTFGEDSIYDGTIEEIESSENVENEVTNRELQKNILDILKHLSEPDFTIIIQKYYFKRNSREISKMVSMSPQAVRVRSLRALKKLRYAFDDLNL